VACEKGAGAAADSQAGDRLRCGPERSERRPTGRSRGVG
jgi:hypothetical protein